MTYKQTLLFLAILLSLSGCNSHDGNHLNIIQLPGAMISNTIENAAYGYTRRKVVTYTRQHYHSLKQEIRKASGRHLDTLLYLAKIQKSNYRRVKTALRRDYTSIFHNTQMVTEVLIRAFAQLYPARTNTKGHNGIHYTQAYTIVKKYVAAHFEPLRLSIKKGQYTELTKLADKLHIHDTAKRQKFLHALDGKYDQLYIDILVVSVMIHKG